MDKISRKLDRPRVEGTSTCRLVVEIGYVLLVLNDLRRGEERTASISALHLERVALLLCSAGSLAFLFKELIVRMFFDKKTGKRDTVDASEKDRAGARLDSSTKEENGKTCVAPEASETTSMRILLARYGTTRRDIDVTSKLQELVTRDTNGSYTLRVPKELNMNRYFGKDPHRFRRKKLRFVAALPDGTPAAHFLNESRRDDFVLKSRATTTTNLSASKVEAVGDAAKESASEEDASSAFPPRSTVLRRTAPTVRAIHRKFGTLRTQLPFGELEVEDLMGACDDIADMISLFGASMLSVRASITDNLSKVRRSMARRDPSADTRIGAVILEEVSNGVMKREGSVCLSSLWLKRSLDFMAVFIADVLRGSDAAKAAVAAYKTTLEPWQGWFVRAACKTGMRLVPNRATILQVLSAPNSANTEKGDTTTGSLVKELEEMMREFTSVVAAMDAFFTEHDLDFPEKC